MISTELARSFTQRFRRPSTWGVIVVFGLVWIAARMLSGMTLQQMGAWEFILPALFLVGHLALSAAPWQWTGDARPSAPMWRGCLQALPWNAAWVFLLLWGVQDLVRPAPPLRSPRPMPTAQRPGPPPPASPSPNRETPPDREAPPDPGDARPNTPPPGLRQELRLLLLNLPFAMILGWFLAEKERAESKERELQSLAREARLNALQSQVHPHALYNTLSGLTELVHEDPDAAEEALVGLTELLRMLTRHAAAAELPLAQERALIRHALLIEEIRLGPRLTVTWNWPDWADGIALPPLLLQPLVENAIKHGIAPSPEGGTLKIGVFRTGQHLVLRVANTGMPLSDQQSEGTGLKNLRERLALLEHLAPTLELRTEEGWTLAELRLRLP